MKINRTKILFSLIFLATIGSGLWYYHTADRGPIYEYQANRDTQDILSLFKSDWYWLVADDEYSPEFMLKYRAPRQDRMYEGRLRIKVLREGDQFIGFSAYYMKTKTIGFINFIAIKPAFRGKRYADILMRDALDGLINMGATEIQLVTRPTNINAQKVYRRFNFEETYNDGEFVYFTYYVH